MFAVQMNKKCYEIAQIANLVKVNKLRRHR